MVESTIPSLAVNLFPLHLESEEGQSAVGYWIVSNSELILVTDLWVSVVSVLPSEIFISSWPRSKFQTPEKLTSESSTALSPGGSAESPGVGELANSPAPWGLAEGLRVLGQRGSCLKVTALSHMHPGAPEDWLHSLGSACSSGSVDAFLVFLFSLFT